MRVFIRAAALTAVMLLLASSAAGEEWYIRVIARDDTAAARQEKMRTAAAALRAMPRDAEAMPLCLPRVFAAAREESDCRCCVRLWSPDEKMPPRPTCYIVIGQGGGHNWWGVLFPDSLRLLGSENAEGDVRLTFPLFFRALERLFGFQPRLQGGEVVHEPGADIHSR